MEAPDFFSLFIVETKQMPADWQWVRLDTPQGDNGGDFVAIEGAPLSTVPQLKSGPRKGKPNWRGVPTQTFIVSRAALDEFQRKWENKTGLCRQCGDTGRVARGWNITTGTRFEACSCGRAAKGGGQ